MQKKIKILIADDDKVVAEISRDIIASEGRSIDLCHDGLCAMEAIRKTGYDLILLDLIMPNVEGLDLLRYAKKITPDVLVIIITGYASLESAIAAIKEGAYDYITKPFKLDEIRIAVGNAVEKIILNREKNDLVEKLQVVYDELVRLKGKKGEDEGMTASRLNFFTTNMSGLHHFYRQGQQNGSDSVEKLQALTSLKESGVLTDKEFDTFKAQLLKKMTDLK